MSNQTGLARALSKLGFCSRSHAWEVIKAGRVRVNGIVQRDPERRVAMGHERIEVDGKEVRSSRKLYLMLNKPRGLVTTSDDEKGRATVFECLKDVAGLQDRETPRLFPVGRLDMASEGLLLFTNDSAWADRLTSPKSKVDKVYHVQIDRLADEEFLRKMEAGRQAGNDFLAVKRAVLLRSGEKNCWIEVTLDEGKNRHIRRLLEALDTEVLRLIRVAIGRLRLGSLAKGQARVLTEGEIKMLG